MTIPIQEHVQCVILAGGKGLRLDGKGKFSKLLNKKSLLEHVITRMSMQTAKIAVNFRDRKFSLDKNYPVVFDKFKKDIGPLAGIHAALSYSLENNEAPHMVVTVPVDTPFIPLDLIKRLKIKIDSTKASVVVAYSGKRYHPTIAIWRTAIIDKLECSIKKNIRKIDVFTSKLDNSYETWKVDKYDPFFNINNNNDLKIAESMIKKNIIC